MFKRTNLSPAVAFLMLSMLAAFSCSADTGRALHKFYDKEIQGVGMPATSAQDGVHRIKIFGGYVNIPNRYVLVGWGGEVIQFNSIMPAGHPLEFKVHGIISAGAYGSLDRDKMGLEDVVKKKKINGLNVSIFYDQARDLETVFVHDNEEYLLIGDSNKKLWKAIIESFERQ